MDVIKSLSQTEDSMTICATIHSPTAHAFALFGKMIILLQGRMVFFGDAGERCIVRGRKVTCMSYCSMLPCQSGYQQHRSVSLPNMTQCAGSSTVNYFERELPGVPAFEQEAGNNAAEWIVNITTKVGSHKRSGMPMPFRLTCV